MDVAAGVAVILTLAAAVSRLICAVKLMTDYRVDEYLATPRSRRLWLVNMAAPLVMVALLTFASYATRLWEVELVAWLLLSAVVCKTVWAVRVRLTGRYREFYQAIQWR